MEMSRKRNSGFTLLEMLITVAILVIVLAFGIVGVARYRDYLKITELDNIAREIYMAAENRAVLLQNSGAARSQVLLLPKSVKVEEKNYRVLVHTPDDGPVTIASLAVPAAAVSPDVLLPAGSIDPALWGGHFFVLYDEDTGHAAEVFYAEKGEIKDEWLPVLRKSRSDRVKDFRSDGGTTPTCLVGHYQGDAKDMADSDVKVLPAPGVEVFIENGNELILTVKYTLPDNLKKPDGTPLSVKRTPSVILEYGGEKVDITNSLRLERKDGQNIEHDIPKAEYTWVLDSLVTKSVGETVIKQQFKDFFGDRTDFIFGKDFKVTAGLTLTADGYVDSAYYAEGTDNSLFAKETGDGDTAYIANLRHLQNLRKKDEDSRFTSKVREGITRAIQTEDIECSKYKEVDYTFIPIHNDFLESFDGQEKKISNLKVAYTDNAGLFREIERTDMTIQNVRLIEPDVKGSQNTGGLVGMVNAGTTCNLDNCRVYWNTPEKLIDGSSIAYKVSGQNAGGLIGCAEGTATITKSFAAATVKGAISAGGLVGSNTGDVTVTGSYADCYLQAESNAAGLVGDSTGTTRLEKSYAAGFIVEPGDSVQTAGLVGGTVNPTAQKCYSVVRVKKDADGKETLEKPKVPMYSGWVENSPDFAFYLSKATDVTHDVKTAWGSDFEYEDGRPETHAYNLRHKLDPTDPTLELTPPYPFPGLTDTKPEGVNEIVIHYGDWAELDEDEDEDVTLELVYYEGYDPKDSKEQYGLRFSKQFTEANPDSDTLTKKDDPEVKIIRRDGYALAVKDEAIKSLETQNTEIDWEGVGIGDTASSKIFKWTLSWNGSKWKWEKADVSPATLEYTDAITVEGSGYKLIPLPEEMVYGNEVPFSRTADLRYYQKLSVTMDTNPERTFYFNPHLPIEIQGPNADGIPPEEPDQNVDTTIKIRTPRHFYDLSRAYNATNGACYYPQANVGNGNMRTFEQEFDLDYVQYKGQLNADGSGVDIEKLPHLQAPIESDKYFTYDGQCHRIQNVFVNGTSTKSVGLFKVLNDNSKLENIVFEMDPENEQKVEPADEVGVLDEVGALLGRCDYGKVENCAVYGVNINATAPYIGGLVGKLNETGIVQRCSAEVACLDGSGNIGGLVGTVQNSAASVADSYAVGYINKTSGSGTVCGLVGNVTYSKTAISDCYAAVRLEGTGTKYGLCNNGTVSNGYWLTGTFRYRGMKYTVDSTYKTDSKKNSKAITPAELEEKLTALEPANRTVYYDISGKEWRADYEGKDFPYLTGVRDEPGEGAGNPIHYGLWPVEIPPEITMFYYEEYADGTYGFYRAIREEGKAPDPIDTLDNNKVIVRDGYALAVKKSDLPWFDSGFKVWVRYGSGGDPKTFSKTDKDSLQWDKLDEDEKEDAKERKGTKPIPLQEVSVGAGTEKEKYVMLPLWYSVHTGERPNTKGYFQSLCVKLLKSDNTLLKPDGKTDYMRTFYFNPHFAKTLFCPAEGSINLPKPVYPTTGSNQTLGDGKTVPICVRTARHFYALSQFTVGYIVSLNLESVSYYFLQERDVDYGTYTGYDVKHTDQVDKLFPLTADGKAYEQRVIGQGENPDSNMHFIGTYDGGNNRLKNVVFAGKNLDKWGLGLFGLISNGGCLKNIIYEPGGKATVNCNISEAYETGGNRKVKTLYAGGLAGSNYKGKIENCAVLGFGVDILSQGETKPKIDNFYVGSLVAMNQSGTIKDCFAEVPNLSVPSAGEANADSFAVGALVGCSYGIDDKNWGKASVENCYAVGTISGGSGTKIAGLVGQSGGRVYTYDYCTIGNSYSAVALGGDADKYNICSTCNNSAVGKVLNCYYLRDRWNYGGRLCDTRTPLQDAAGTDYTITSKTYDELKTLTINGMNMAAGGYPFPVSTKDKGGNWHYFGVNWPVPMDNGTSAVQPDESITALSEPAEESVGYETPPPADESGGPSPALKPENRDKFSGPSPALKPENRDRFSGPSPAHIPENPDEFSGPSPALKPENPDEFSGPSPTLIPENPDESGSTPEDEPGEPAAP